MRDHSYRVCAIVNLEWYVVLRQTLKGLNIAADFGVVKKSPTIPRVIGGKRSH